MSLQAAFSQQIMAFHGAIMDDCNRAAGADRSDSMVLRLRNNAVAMTKLQLAMLAVTGADPAEPETEAEPWPERETESEPWPEPEPDEPEMAEPYAAEPLAFDGERVLAGDALSRFVSRPMAPDESPHEAWQRELDNDPVRRRRTPVLPEAGFRSPPS